MATRIWLVEVASSILLRGVANRRWLVVILISCFVQKSHQTYTCEVCSKVLSLHNRASHLKICKKPPDVYTCQRCDFETLDKASLTSHKETAHRRFVCDHCGYQARTQDRLDRHINLHLKVFQSGNFLQIFVSQYLYVGQGRNYASL